MAVKALEAAVGAVLSSLDVFSLPAAERRVVTLLQRELVDARLDIRDYELSETREEQLRKAAESRKRLDKIRKNILAASEFNVFGAVDVAQLTASLEQISENIV